MKVLITGGTGFIGSHLAEHLVREGHEVHCLARRKATTSLLAQPGVELLEGDVTEAASLKGCVREAGAVIHLAGLVSVSQAVREPSATFFSHAVGTLNVLEELRRESDHPLFIYLSSDRVYGSPTLEVVDETYPPQPLDPYAAAKLSGEILSRAYAVTYLIPVVVFRVANTYGPRQLSDLFIPGIIRRIVASGGNTIQVGHIDGYRNFIYVHDVVSACALVLANRETVRDQIFNLGHDVVPLRRVVDLLVDLSDRKLGRRIRLADDPVLARSPGVEIGKYNLDSSKAERMLGWSPRYSLEKGLEATFDYYLGVEG